MTTTQRKPINVKIPTLLAILDEETACYQKMEKILSDEEESISFSKNARFDEVQSEKNALLLKFQQFEEKRKPIVDALSEKYAADGKPLTISQLAKLVKPPYGEKLLGRANRLRSIIGNVQEKNSRNQLLIHQYLDLTKESLKLLTHLMEDDSVYQRPGIRHAAAGYHCGGGRLIRGSV
jgi:flagellar biosynthesis/type III secretory pathway chaperone